VLAETSISGSGSIIVGDVGLSPGTSITGGPAITGTTFTGASAVSALAIADAQATYNSLGSLPGGLSVTGDLGVGTLSVLTPGIYDFSSSAQLTGTLTLSGSGLYVFRIVSTLTTGSGSSITLANGAEAANVFFNVGSSATLGSGTTFQGNIISQISTTLNTSTVNGRVIALDAAVVLNDSTVRLIPEPGSSALLSSLVMLAFLRRRR
jgi:type VI secretion system secreted protein VgrG